jgi:hypothetical protein
VFCVAAASTAVVFRRTRVSSLSSLLLAFIAKTRFFLFDSLFFLLVLAMFVEQVAGGHEFEASEDNH